MSLPDILNYVLSYMNGPLETGALMVLVIVDTIFALQAVNADPNKRAVSEKAMTGILINFATALVPAATSFIGWGSALIPYPHQILIDVALTTFDVASAVLFYIIAKFIIKSIMANYTLAGGELPEGLTKWIADELEHKSSK